MRKIFSPHLPYITASTSLPMLLVELYEACEAAPAMALPLYESSVPAGSPSPADDYIDLKFDLNDYLVHKPCDTYYAKVSGDSMTGTGILDGDIGASHQKKSILSVLSQYLGVPADARCDGFSGIGSQNDQMPKLATAT